MVRNNDGNDDDDDDASTISKSLIIIILKDGRGGVGTGKEILMGFWRVI